MVLMWETDKRACLRLVEMLPRLSATRVCAGGSTQACEGRYRKARTAQSDMGECRRRGDATDRNERQEVEDAGRKGEAT